MARELITFEVGGQLFGLDITAIREIRAWSPVTRVPGVPHYVAGMANLRGSILPVIDLATRLGWGGTDPDERHAIIVVDIAGKSSGLIVESVSDLIDLGDAPLQPPPNASDYSFIEGLAPIGDRMVLVLNLSALNDENSFAGGF
ncbi:chemotaxis protein CheW [Novosphingobium sp. FSY-8]|uniref:Chemotaxis protein CheW n=1 Tax=Novosphingobium ovatum TaxID=1908523 RepID=A0ABW9XBH4_9SPHN|nr:chemotaxis protein CheW [Novosphingobium ovatum]NBC35878.1 chemotaxis protein CheW [Novosphingobium ovatum]